MERKYSHKVEEKTTAELIPYINNSRTHSEQQVKQIASSIKEFGFTNPILIDEDNGVIAGHGRLQAAEILKLSTVPVIVLKNLTEAQKKAYVIADNQIALTAEWDLDKLRADIETLHELDFNVDLLGFEDEFLDKLLEPEPLEGLTDEDDVPDAPEKPITELGDIYLLGRHHLMCGDATNIMAVEELMTCRDTKNLEIANMLFTDPPYLMDFTGGIHADGSKSFNAKHGKIKNDHMSLEEGDDFLDSINTIIKTKVDGAFYISFYRLGIDRYYESLKRTGLKSRSLIIWNKGNHTLSNSDYMSMYEPIFYGWVNSHKFYGGKNGMDIWNIPRTAKNTLHPTMKPVALCEKAILDGSQINGIVLDLFGGSGSTLIASEKTNRQCRTMELDPKYCDVIVKRWVEYTGKHVFRNGNVMDKNEWLDQK